MSQLVDRSSSAVSNGTGVYVDHIGVVVTDLDASVDFFCRFFGATELFRTSRPAPTDDFMEVNFAVPRDSTFDLAMLRFGPNLNRELFEWSGPHRNTTMPSLSDLGATHIALHDPDLEARVADLESSPHVTRLGAIKTAPPDSPAAGTRWCYLAVDFGFVLELVARPPHLPYEADTASRLHRASEG
jgi:2-epi-5-epi-valiolone epimerase